MALPDCAGGGRSAKGAQRFVIADKVVVHTKSVMASIKVVPKMPNNCPRVVPGAELRPQLDKLWPTWANK